MFLEPKNTAVALETVAKVANETLKTALTPTTSGTSLVFQIIKKLLSINLRTFLQ